MSVTFLTIRMKLLQLNYSNNADNVAVEQAVAISAVTKLFSNYFLHRMIHVENAPVSIGISLPGSTSAFAFCKMHSVIGWLPLTCLSLLYVHSRYLYNPLKPGT